tara:strand:+ start:351089 stop:352015 length:927 start_codon:yes stop_codon:yes gene_type:complete
MIKVSRNLLQNFYLILPLSLLVVLIDILFLDHQLQSFLPNTPNKFFLFTLFFVLPHIVASLITFGEKEYVVHYKKQLSYSLIFSLIVTLIFVYITPQKAYLAIFGIITLFHVIGQQFGLNSGFAQVRGKIFLWWKYIGFTSALFSSTLLYFPQTSSLNLYYSFIAINIFFLIFFLFLTVKCIKLSTNDFGKRYFIANFLLLLFTFVFVLLKYPFFAILGPRFVHDTTAFTFYAVHNFNRSTVSRNKVLNPITKMNFSILLTFLSAIIIALFVKDLNYFGLITFLTILHYCVESFMWKGKTLHKEFIRF